MKVAVCVFGCITMPKYCLQVLKIQETWGKRAEETHGVPVYYFLGEERLPGLNHPELWRTSTRLVFLPGVGNDYQSASFKQNRGIKYILDHHPEVEFVFVCGTDTFLNIDALLRLLTFMHPDEKLYIGGHHGIIPLTNLPDLTTQYDTITHNVQGDEILQPQNAGEHTQEARRSFVQGDEILQPQNAGEQTQEARRSFVVSRGIDFFHSVQHNYHKELTFDVVIGGYTVWHTTIKPNSIEWIFGGMPLLLINIQFSIVRLIIRDGDKILHTNQLDLTLYYGAIIDSSERRFIAQNPPFCQVNEGKYLHNNYVMDAEEEDLMLKRNLIFYPHR